MSFYNKFKSKALIYILFLSIIILGILTSVVKVNSLLPSIVLFILILLTGILDTFTFVKFNFKTNSIKSIFKILFLITFVISTIVLIYKIYNKYDTIYSSIAYIVSILFLNLIKEKQ